MLCYFLELSGYSWHRFMWWYPWLGLGQTHKGTAQLEWRMQKRYAPPGRNIQDIYRLFRRRKQVKEVNHSGKGNCKNMLSAPGYVSWRNSCHVHNKVGRSRARHSTKPETAHISVNRRMDLFPCLDAQVGYYTAGKNERATMTWILETWVVKKTSPRRQIKLHAMLFEL